MAVTACCSSLDVYLCASQLAQQQAMLCTWREVQQLTLIRRC